MPSYLFSNPQTGEIVEVMQSINADHQYEKDGIKYDRVFTVPQAAIDTEIDCRDPQGFADKTGKKKGSLGDIWDASAELAQKRKEKEGRDLVKEEYIKQYSAKRKGKKPPGYRDSFEV